MAPFRKIAIVGAGVSGLVCARELLRAGRDVTVFEKSRGVGGRLATRRLEPGFAFDHGAQFITATDPGFQTELENACEAGAAAVWEGRIAAYDEGQFFPILAEHRFYVGTPGMASFAKHLARGTRVNLLTRPEGLVRENGAWYLAGEFPDKLGPFDAVLSSAPVEQTRQLFQSAPSFVERLLSSKLAPCWAVMASFESALSFGWDGFFSPGENFSWACRNSSKPGRTASPETWVLHGSPSWSAAHLEDREAEVAEALLKRFFEVIQIPESDCTALSAHRWRYSLPIVPLGQASLWDPTQGLGVCGDWCLGPKVEAAYLSGKDLARSVIQAQ